MGEKTPEAACQDSSCTTFVFPPNLIEGHKIISGIGAPLTFSLAFSKKNIENVNIFLNKYFSIIINA